ncbi:uncharacterized protein LOC108670761 [Hyalella azteca]|uniref:Uncharacterized protein LOC108670761 n=1 Tax=Hyalella azteca TaxID=294128 RepID=A0A8B7NJB3_HYAAZ|nr:uncharacterized protein LOC108670761 [Hyalella azteca]
MYGSYKSTMCIAGTTKGKFKSDCSKTATCTPGSSGCYFCFPEDETAEQVQASLGYMPALSTGKFCDAGTHVRDTPSPQNILCDGRSIMEVIQQHPDYGMMSEHATTDPLVTITQEPLGRVLLLLDTPPASAPAGVSQHLF